jgi:hypothetical protein
MRRTTTAVACGLLVAGVVAGPGTALADPKKGEPFTLDCGSAGVYDVVVAPGSGTYTPGLDLDSNRVLVPTAFGPFTGTLTGPGGFSSTETEPGSTKGPGAQRGAVPCEFSITEVFTLTAEEAAAEGLPGAGTYTFVGEGVVFGQVRGR